MKNLITLLAVSLILIVTSFVNAQQLGEPLAKFKVEQFSIDSISSGTWTDNVFEDTKEEINLMLFSNYIVVKVDESVRLYKINTFDQKTGEAILTDMRSGKTLYARFIKLDKGKVGFQLTDQKTMISFLMAYVTNTKSI